MTLTLHRLRLPAKLRRNLASTNLIESSFSAVDRVCRSVKCWRGGDQYLRWVVSGLLWAESNWKRIYGYRELPILLKKMEAAVVRATPVRHASVT